MSKKASAKLSALTRVLDYMNPNPNFFFSSQFAYCPLTWMFDRGELNHKIKRVHEDVFV